MNQTKLLWSTQTLYQLTNLLISAAQFLEINNQLGSEHGQDKHIAQIFKIFHNLVTVSSTTNVSLLGKNNVKNLVKVITLKHFIQWNVNISRLPHTHDTQACLKCVLFQKLWLVLFQILNEFELIQFSIFCDFVAV